MAIDNPPLRESTYSASLPKDDPSYSLAPRQWQEWFVQVQQQGNALATSITALTTRVTTAEAAIVVLQAGLGYAMVCASRVSTNPVDGSIQYVGSSGTPTAGVADIQRLYIPKAGRIRVVSVFVWAATPGSNENIAVDILLNNSGVTNVGNVKADATQNTLQNTGLTLAVVVGDYIEVRFTNPTWATNPTGNVVYTANVYLSVP